jgi:hypothetical protein
MREDLRSSNGEKTARAYGLVPMPRAYAASLALGERAQSMLSVETGVRWEVVQLGGVLLPERPAPGQELVYDSIRYLLVDFRGLLGEWHSLTRAGESLVIRFDEQTSIRLQHFFNTGIGAPTEVLVQVGDTVLISPETFFRSFAGLEEKRAVSESDEPAPAGAWFLPTPLVPPVGDDEATGPLADENSLVPDDPIPEVTEDLFEIDSPLPPDPVVVPDEEEQPPETVISPAIINAVFGDMSQPLD